MMYAWVYRLVSTHLTYTTSPLHLKTPLLQSNARRPTEIQHLKNQMSNILHALSSTFTTCACGARARDCALTQMAAFVDGQQINVNRHRDNLQLESTDSLRIDMGPLVGRKRGFKTRERIPHSGGIGGMEIWREDDASTSGKGRGLVWDGPKTKEKVSGIQGYEHPALPNFMLVPSSPSRKGKEKAVHEDVEMADGCSTQAALKPVPTGRFDFLQSFHSLYLLYIIFSLIIADSVPHLQLTRTGFKP